MTQSTIQSKTHLESEPLKQQGDKLDPVPAPDNGGHSHSAAAHLGTSHAHTKPEGKNQQSGALREPPSVVERSGKQHR